MYNTPFISSNINFEAEPNGICFDNNYCLTSERNTAILSELIPIYPNQTQITRELKDTSYFINYVLKTGDYSLAKERKYKISHIAECISQIISLGNCQNNCCVYISIYHKNAFVFVKRISDPIFSNVFKFSTAEDFLYHIQSVFEALNLNNSNDKIFVLGSIDTESQIVRLLKIYFLNVAVEHNFNFSGEYSV
ncbi:MAG: DUF3822 family protein [Saprospiraceae bacterium]|nr:DUF3822 family protein [Saprospiraceae bacterium]